MAWRAPRAPSTHARCSTVCRATGLPAACESHAQARTTRTRASARAIAPRLRRVDVISAQLCRLGVHDTRRQVAALAQQLNIHLRATCTKAKHTHNTERRDRETFVVRRACAGHKPRLQRCNSRLGLCVRVVRALIRNKRLLRLRLLLRREQLHVPRRLRTNTGKVVQCAGEPDACTPAEPPLRRD